MEVSQMLKKYCVSLVVLMFCLYQTEVRAEDSFLIETKKVHQDIKSHEVGIVFEDNEKIRVIYFDGAVLSKLEGKSLVNVKLNLSGGFKMENAKNYLANLGELKTKTTIASDIYDEDINEIENNIKVENSQFNIEDDVNIYRSSKPLSFYIVSGILSKATVMFVKSKI